MSIDITASTVRTLKGAPLSCLILMSLAGQPVTAEYLERNSGYSDKPVLAALRLLEEYGLITHNERYAWQIADGVRQMPLMVQDWLHCDNNSYSQQGTKITNDEGGARAQSSDEEDQSAVVIEGETVASSQEGLVQNNRPLGGLAKTARPQEGLTENVRPQEGLLQNSRNNSESEKFRVPSSRSLNPVVNPESGKPLLDVAGTEKLRVRNVLAACDRAGIREPKRSEIAQNQRVYPELVEYHVQTSPNTSMAIYRILHDWKIKPGWQPAREDVRAQTPVKERPVVSDALSGAWKSAQKRVEATMRAVDYQTWVAGLEVIGESAGVISVDAHNAVALAWVREHCLAELQAGMREALGGDVVIELVKGW